MRSQPITYTFATFCRYPIAVWYRERSENGYKNKIHSVILSAWDRDDRRVEEGFGDDSLLFRVARLNVRAGKLPSWGDYFCATELAARGSQVDRYNSLWYRYSDDDFAIDLHFCGSKKGDAVTLRPR